MKEKQHFYSSLGLLIILNLLIKPVWIFAIDRQVQNRAGTEEYGAYFSLLGLSVVFSFLLDWGLTVFFNQQTAAQKKELSDHTGRFLLIKLFFAILYSLLLFLIAWLSGNQRWDILPWVILIQVFSSLFTFFRAILTAHQWFITDAWLSVADKGLMILVCGSLLLVPAVFGAISLNRFLLIQTVCTALAALLALLILLYRRINFSLKRIEPELRKKIARQALPFALIILLMSVHFRADGFLLERLHPQGQFQAGIYAAAYRLLDAANMIGLLFASFLLPFVARQWSRRQELSSVVLQVRHVLLLFSIQLALIVVFLAPWLDRLLYNHDNAATEVLQYCLPAVIGYSLNSIYGTVMTATGHIRQYCYITAAAVLSNCCFNLMLIPVMGAKGSCIAALISQFGSGIAAMVFLQKKEGIPVHVPSLMVYLLVAAVTTGFLRIGTYAAFNPWLLIGASCLLTMLIAVLTGLVKPGKWLQLLKERKLKPSTDIQGIS